MQKKMIKMNTPRKEFSNKLPIPIETRKIINHEKSDHARFRIPCIFHMLISNIIRYSDS